MQDEDLVNIPEEGTVFFGVGDEVLVAGGSVLALVVVLAVWLGTSRTGNNNVHPSQASVFVSFLHCYTTGSVCRWLK